MGALRSQAYAMSWPDEVISVICLDGALLPLELLPTELSNMVSKIKYSNKILSLK